MAAANAYKYVEKEAGTRVYINVKESRNREEGNITILEVC
jgi:hypothetical protein